MDYTMQDACKRLELTVHTVRHYCDMGLVPNLRHDRNGNRIFDEESLNWLQAAKFLRANGLSIPQIRHYFDLCQDGKASIRERQAILIELRTQAQQELEALKARIGCLTDRISHCQEVIDTDADDDCNPLNW